MEQGDRLVMASSSSRALSSMYCIANLGGDGVSESVEGLGF